MSGAADKASGETALMYAVRQRNLVVSLSLSLSSGSRSLSRPHLPSRSLARRAFLMQRPLCHALSDRRSHAHYACVA